MNFTIVLLLLALFGCAPELVEEIHSTSSDIILFAGSTTNSDYIAEVSPEGASILIEGVDASLLIEAVTGERRSEDVLAEHDELGEYEIDFRVVDSNGIPFIMGFGGDFWAESSWEKDYEESLAIEVDLLDRETHYELLGEAVEALQNIQGDQLNFPLDTLNGVATSRFVEWRDKTLEIDDSHENETGEIGNSTGAPPPATTYRHYAYIYYSPLWWSAYSADHSSTRALATSSSGGTTYYDLSYGNHGRYYNEAGMSYSCGTYWSGRSSKSLKYSPYGSTDTSYDNPGGGCSTSYGWTSKLHNCNDDSYAQYGNVKNNSYSSWSTCGDSTLRDDVPTCSSI